MKYSDIIFSEGEYKISSNSLANLFGVEYKNGNYEFRSNKTISIVGSNKANQEMFDFYKISAGDSWASISYKFYNTTDLWWIICKFNNTNNPNIIPNIGTTLMIPKKEFVEFVL